MTGFGGTRPCTVLGVLNVTPDSFSDGGRYTDLRAAVRRGLEMHEQGADVVDVGGESTRPGAGRVTAAEELRRVVPVVTELVACGVTVSIDTTRTSVARAAVAAGATIVNDVSGGWADADLPRLVADTGVCYVVMHSRGPSADMAERAVYGDVVTDVVDELALSVARVGALGVRAAQVVVDPGLGFAKQPQHSWRLLRGLDRVLALGYPVLVGASRKSFLGGSPFGPARLRRDVDERDGVSAALAAIVAAAGVWGVRVHDVARTVEAVQVAAAITGAGSAAPDAWSAPWPTNGVATADTVRPPGGAAG